MAVAGVLLFHAGHLRGGFLGVDLFFVLSGFLITSLLLAEHEATGAIALGHFWSRRLRRLLPALLVVLAAVALYGWLALPATELSALRRDGLGTLGYVANWVAIHSGGDYWAIYQAPSLLEHTWSIAIEEQFYLLWPLVVVVLLRGSRSSRARLIAATAVLILVSLGRLLAAYHPGGDASRAYYGTDTRIAAILYGALVAGLLGARLRPAGGRAERALGAVAPLASLFLAVGWMIASGTAPWVYQWGLPAFGVAAACVIAGVTGPHAGSLGRALAVRPLRYVGALSYGLYLWHWPIFVVVDADRTGLSGWPLTVLRVTLSLAAADISLRVIERPVRLGRAFRARWGVWAPAGMALVGLLLIVATVGGVTRPAPLAGDARASQPDPSASVAAPIRVLLVGDSQAFRLGESFEPAAAPGVALWTSTRLGCGLSDGISVNDTRVYSESSCDDLLTDWVSSAAAAHPDVVVLLTGAWEVMDREIDGRLVPFGSPGWDEATRVGLDRAFAALQAPGRGLVAMAAPCFQAETDGGFPTGQRNDPARVARFNSLLGEVAAARDVRVLDYFSLLCPTGRYDEHLGSVVARLDGVHLTPVGGNAVWRWLGPKLVTPEPAASGARHPT